MNVLVVAHDSISNPKGGNSNRIYNIATQLQKDGNEITVLELNNAKNNRNQSEFKIYEYLGNIGKRNISVFSDFNPHFIFKLLQLIIKFKIDIIQVESPWGTSIAKLICKLIGKNTKVVYSSQNYEVGLHKELKEYYENLEDRNLYKIFIYNLIYTYTRIIEKLTVNLSDLILCVSDDDKELFIEKYKVKSSKIMVIPNGINTEKLFNSSRNKNKFGLDENKISVIFHGSYTYPPNYEAVNVIRNYIYPEFTNELQQIEFIIAGADLPVYNDGKGLKLLGYVDDLYSLLKSSDIAIVPILRGGGTKLKMLDYMGIGLPIVTTKKGIEGIKAKNGNHALIVEDVNEKFIEAMKYLIENEDKRKEIAMNANNLAMNEYGWEKIVEKLDKFYKEKFM